MIYLDSTAIVTLLSGRQGADSLRAELESRGATPIATSTVGFVETVRTLDRIGSYPNLMSDLVQDFTEILITEEVRVAAAALPSGVRTLDALHIASAQVLGDDLHLFISYDRRMLAVANLVELPTAAPGLGSHPVNY